MDGLTVVAACVLFAVAAVALYLADVAAARDARRFDRLDETTRKARRRQQAATVPAAGRSDANRAPTRSRLQHAARRVGSAPAGRLPLKAVEVLLLSQSGKLDLLLQERSFHILALVVRYGKGRSHTWLGKDDVRVPPGGLTCPCPAAALKGARMALATCQRQVSLPHLGL
jgi:hypothetical protein